ncbi:MAG: UvrD-helicase domain-containing protein [Rhodopseudomonas palustris]|uniref:DNA 3'-5' helicase II n=1 Tax=Rhodopseudomonas palustris TaxID=1076 RepID=A0A933S2J1_RHOPL|nr:UvrD-helicase domain-containing protein [Rhodopseudomonas palustris]
MSVEFLVVDGCALGILDAALIDESWFDNFNIPQNTEGLRRVRLGSVVYLLSASASLESGVVVVKAGSKGIFKSVAKPRAAFERIMRVGLRQFDRNIAVPVAWQPYHEGSLLSVYAESFNRKMPHRIYFDQAAAGSGNLYAFAVTETPEPLDRVAIDLAGYRAAVDGLLEALLEEAKPLSAVGNFGILLSAPLGFELTGSGTLQEWYDRKLSDEQLRFVDQPHDRPVRLRGAAGTGKTQAMAVKCLRDLYADADAGGDKTFAFLTHSAALAHEVVRGMFFALDQSARWTDLKTAAGRPKLWVGTLYEFAQEQLSYEKKGLKPLSLDGRDGRELQRLLIEDAIEEVSRNPRTALGVLRECPEFADRMNDKDQRVPFVEELMNEFACSLDAENVRKGTPAADKYINGSREGWQMLLPSSEDRRAVLEIYESYQASLRKERLLSMDQMIADFGRYLTTHEWNQLRDMRGFDLIFVDEYHYFTRVEAMILQNMFATRAERVGRWPLIMAYDLKQSTNDAALGGGLERFRNPGVGESVPVDLKQVHRSTPQIAAFLSDLDASFPAIDLEGEFVTYAGNSRKADGDFPVAFEISTNVKLIDAVLDRALSVARTLAGGGSQVAVLCINDELFDDFCKAGRTKDKIVPVRTREDLRELRYARSRCVFSMPEYVAGLQFDTVFLIHLDQVDLTGEYLSQGARRRYVSRVYLGASRAARQLLIASSSERGGLSEILRGPIASGSLKESSF